MRASPVLRIALASSWAGRAVDRRRAAMLAVATAVVTVMASGCLSAWLMSGRIDERATARAFSPARADERVSFERSALFDEAVNGDQIYVYWWRVLDPTVEIPGVGASPPTGSWFVSPALEEKMDDNSTLIERYPSARVISESGLAHRGELLAYRFVGPDVALSERLSARAGSDWIGDGAEVVDAYPIAVAALALIGIPGVGLLLAAMAPLAVALETRLAILHALGASSTMKRAVVVLQTLLSSLPGSFAGVVGWFVVAPRLLSVPFVGRQMFEGDLRLPIGTAVATAAGVCLLAVAVASVRPRRLASNRPSHSRPRTPTVLRAAPLAAGVAVMAAAAVVPGRTGAKLFLVGVLAATVGAVVALPYLMDRAGRLLATQSSTLGLLVGRRMRANAVASTRSLITVGTLAALLPVIGAWVAVARTVDRPPTAEHYVVELRGQATADEVAELERRTGASTLGVAAQIDAIGRESLQLVGDCRSLIRVLRFTRCDGQQFHLDPAVDLGGYQGLPGVPVRAANAEPVSTLFVSESGPDVEHALRQFVVNAPHAGMQVLTPGRAFFHESPLVRWILGAAQLAGLVGGLALVLHLAGQAARFAPSRLRLISIGCSGGEIRRLVAAEASLAVVAVGLGCTVVGYVSSWMFVQLDETASVPYGLIGIVALGVLGASAVAGIAAALAANDRARYRDVQGIGGGL